MSVEDGMGEGTYRAHVRLLCDRDSTSLAGEDTKGFSVIAKPTPDRFQELVVIRESFPALRVQSYHRQASNALYELRIRRLLRDVMNVIVEGFSVGKPATMAFK